jgi:GNAT superfamily N-acetyltransferase
MDGITIRYANDQPDLYARALQRCPDTSKYIDDPNDDGEYHFLLALTEADELVGHAVIDIGEMGFGPLGDQVAGYLEDVEVDEPYRRRGIGMALLQEALDCAWQRRAVHVRWTVLYNNSEGLGLYRKIGAAFIPEEDPSIGRDADYYTVVIQRQ